MARRIERSLKWAAAAIGIALCLSILALALPERFGGYNDWTDWHLALHNLAAILTRIVVFAGIGATLGEVWHRLRRRHREPTLPRHG
jgi:hypothetical protein